jgi:hypothetical protein
MSRARVAFGQRTGWVGHADASVWAVGFYDTGTSPGTDAGVRRTLIERYTC